MKLLQNLWMLMALLGGLALLLCVTLGYSAMWTERPAGDRLPSRHGGLLRRVPWLLIVIYAASVVFSIAYVVAKSLRPPNW
jgi:uncharacterized BrkB/YihY/UPF0761 family membrane protein